MSSPENKVLEKALSGSLEVEHLLDLALVGDLKTAEFLSHLCDSLDWQDADSLPGNSVPYRAWATVVKVYLKDSYAGLEALAQHGYINFIIALLEHLHTSDSLTTILRIFPRAIENPKDYEDLSDSIVSAINVILSFPPAVCVSKSTEDTLREFVHGYIESTNDEHRYGTALCALRDIGDESSIKLIKSKSKLSGQWLGTESIVIGKITDRLRPNLS